MKQLVYFLLFVPFIFSCGSDEDVKPSNTNKSIYYRVDNLSDTDMTITLQYQNSGPGVDKKIIETKTLAKSTHWETNIVPEKTYELIVLKTVGNNYRVRSSFPDFTYDKTLTIESGLEIETNF